MTRYQFQGMLRSKSDMYPISPHHQCAHFWPFSAILEICCPTCTMLSPPVHTGGRAQWTVCGMWLTNIGPHDSHTTWVDHCQHSQRAGPG